MISVVNETGADPEGDGDAARELADALREIPGLQVAQVTTDAPEGTRAGMEWLLASFVISVWGARPIHKEIAQGFPTAKRVKEISEQVGGHLKEVMMAFFNRHKGKKMIVRSDEQTLEIYGYSGAEIDKVIKTLVRPGDK
jgi:hypothetical protein